MIIVTGAVGFIGSCLIGRLNASNFNAIIAVDVFSNVEKNRNLDGKKILSRIDRSDFPTWLDDNYEEVEFLFDIGTSTNPPKFEHYPLRSLNMVYSKMLWQKCIDYQIPLVLVSYEATYRIGEHGFDGDAQGLCTWSPLNPKRELNYEFDQWARAQEQKPFFWARLNFLNVYGPNEYHKGRMASVVFHVFNQVRSSGGIILSKPHSSHVRGQMFDFIYVKDMVEACVFMMHLRKNSGIYNLVSGRARTLLDLSRAVFCALDIPENISFIDTPADIHDKYQIFAETNIAQLQSFGFNHQMHSLEEGVQDYVQNYLIKQCYY